MAILYERVFAELGRPRDGANLGICDQDNLFAKLLEQVTLEAPLDTLTSPGSPRPPSDTTPPREKP